MFYIDNAIVGQWEGNQPWTKVSFPVSAGDHNFRWIYDKDTYVSSGSDCAWLDYIELPTALMTTANAGIDAEICDGENYSCSGSATNYVSIEWSTAGTGYFDNSSLLHAVYTPGSDDITNGSVVLTLTVNGADETMTDDMTLTIAQQPIVVTGITANVCSGDDFIADNVTAENYSSLNWITSGDGTFDDPSALQTVYTPGNADLSSGQVLLTLTADGNGGCDAVSENLTLSITASPEVMLGDDVSLCSDLTLVLDAGNPGATYLWSTGATSQTIVAESGGVFGDMTFWVDVTDNNDCVGYDEIIINFEDCSGFGESIFESGFSIYPNPSNGNFVLEFGKTGVGKVDILVTNSLGELVYKQLSTVASEGSNTRIDLSEQSKGIYLIKVRSDNQIITKKIVIK